MEKKKYYENYPVKIIILTSAVTFLTYFIGTVIFYIIGGYRLALDYAVLCIASLLLAVRFRCCYCCYYGKNCASGLGWLAGKIFRKKDSSLFISPKYIYPVAFLSFIVLFAPVVTAIIFMFIAFSSILLLFTILYFIVAFILGFYSKKRLCCEHCKQGKLGCPAYKGMTKDKKTKNK